MERRGFALTAYPSPEEPGTYSIDLFREDWVDGELCTIDMIARSTVEFDPEWIDAVPDDQFAYTMLEVASQMAAEGAPEGVAASLSESIAEQFKEKGIQVRLT